MICLSGIDGVVDGTLMTFNRKVYEERPREANQTLAFGTYGDPVFEAVVDTVTAHDMPGCIRKLTAGFSDKTGEIMAFAVACNEPDSETRIRLVTAWNDLKNLQICENASISDLDLEQAQKTLETMLEQEYSHIAAVKRLELQNLNAATAQETLNLLSALSLIKPIGTQESDNFHQVVNGLYQGFKDRDQQTIPLLPVPILQKIAPDLLFPVRVPQLGETMAWTAPIFVLSGAVDAAVRLADGMRVKRAELTVGAVRSRIQREISGF
jgi:hypothetical protein